MSSCAYLVILKLKEKLKGGDLLKGLARIVCQVNTQAFSNLNFEDKQENAALKPKCLPADDFVLSLS